MTSCTHCCCCLHFQHYYGRETLIVSLTLSVCLSVCLSAEREKLLLLFDPLTISMYTKCWNRIFDLAPYSPKFTPKSGGTMETLPLAAQARLMLGWMGDSRQVYTISVCSLGQLSLSSLWGRLIEYQPFWLRLGGALSLVSGGR